MGPRMIGLLRQRLRILLAVVMIGIGVTHFVKPDDFAAIVPPSFPAKMALVLISGVAEIAGGVGLLLPRWRRWASLGLVALYVAVFPANVNMAVNDVAVAGVHGPAALLWLRLPFQLVFIAWAIFVGRADVPTPASSSPSRELPSTPRG